MITSTPWNEQEWRRIAELGDDMLIHAAMRMGLAGDIKSLVCMAELAVQDATFGPGDPTFSCAGITHSVRVLPNTKGSKTAYQAPDTTDVEMLNASCMRAFALGLSRDPDRCGETKPTRLDITDRVIFDAKKNPARTIWTDDDARLVRAAVHLWAHDPFIFKHFFTACARFVRHPGFIATLVEEGVSMGALLKDTRETAVCKVDLGDVQMTYTPSALMLRSCNIASIAELLKSLAPTRAGSEDFDACMADSCIFELLSHINSIHDYASKDFVIGLAHVSALDVSDPQRALLGATVEMFDELSRWDRCSQSTQWPSPPQAPWVARAKTLCSYLTAIDAASKRFDPEFVQGMLHGHPKSGPTLAQVLSDPLYFESENNDTVGTLAGLVSRASASHCAQLLISAKTYMQSMALHHQHSLIKCVALCNGGPGRNASLHSEDFQHTLQIFQASGVDVMGVFESVSKDKVVQSTLLHALAESSHPDKLEALMGALQEGADPMLRNSRGRRPSSSVTDKALRAQWVGVENSFLARQAALDAIAQIASDLRVSSSA